MMTWRQHIDFSPIPFVKAKTSDEDWFSAGCPSKSAAPEEKTTDGREIKVFYEELVGLSAGDDKAKSSRRDNRQEEQDQRQDDSETTVDERDSSLTARAKCTVNEYLWAAQNGDIRLISSLLRAGMDINAWDQYKWTALMCAAGAGHSSVVKLLLCKGADKLLVNSNGKTALDIARHCHHDSVVQLLEATEIGEKDEKKSTNMASPFYCVICEANFSDTNEAAHNTSTIHLFNMRLKPKRTLYQISETNRGFQMMLRSGWNEETGLGKQGQGQKFPVKTVLKRDRQGLGCAAKSKAKVTHFGANDTEAIKQVKKVNREMRAKTMGKRARLKAMKRERQKEIQFRREFYVE